MEQLVILVRVDLRLEDNTGHDSDGEFAIFMPGIEFHQVFCWLSDC